MKLFLFVSVTCYSFQVNSIAMLNEDNAITICKTIHKRNIRIQ